MASCKECLHIAVCGRYSATGGHVKECEHFAGDRNAPSKWIPVTERMPEVVSTHKHRRYTSQKSIRVLCVCVQKSGKRMVKEGYCEWYLDYPEPRWRVPGTIDSVTHWMPHPELPKEDDNG